MVEDEKKGFSIHFIAYALVNALFIAINLTFDPKTLWFLYPLLGWGSGISMHYLFSVRWIEKELKERETKAEYRVRKT